MKKAYPASVMMVALISAWSAIAADLTLDATSISPLSPPIWTGFYVGLNAGYNVGVNANILSQNWSGSWSIPGIPTGILPGTAVTAMDAVGSNTKSGFIGGGQIGYNCVYGSRFLLGVEADIQGTDIRGTSTSSGVTSVRQRTNLGLFNITLGSNAVGSSVSHSGIDWLGTVRGRIGYLWKPDLLVYGTGGLAYGNAYASVEQLAIENISNLSGAVLQSNKWLGSGNQDQILSGWTVGGGFEWIFIPNWSLKAEALYWDMGGMNVKTVSYGISGRPDFLKNNIGWGSFNMNYSGVISRAGMNYHFSFTSVPVVVKL